MPCSMQSLSGQSPTGSLASANETRATSLTRFAWRAAPIASHAALGLVPLGGAAMPHLPDRNVASLPPMGVARARDHGASR